MVKIVRHPLGPRVWIFGQRIHHGATGCLLAAAFCRRRRLLAGLGLALAHPDRADWRIWFRRDPVRVLT